MTYDVVIIGGGPSGLMAAYQLQKENINYVLLEKNSLLGKKLLITGQGRCNVTNHLDTNQFITQLTIPHRKFLYSSLSAFGTSDIVDFFEGQRVPLYQDGDLKYFPKSNKAVDILDVFRSKITKNVKRNTEVMKITKSSTFLIETNRGNMEAKNVIVATGSCSFPTTGSTGIGSKLAKSFDIETRAFYPAETSVYSSFVKRNKECLQGIAIRQSQVHIANTKIRMTGDVLFTHFGLSGPSIFHLSEKIHHALQRGKVRLEISLTNTAEEVFRSILFGSNQTIHILRLLEGHTVKRLAKFLLLHLRLDNVHLASISNKKKEEIIENLFRFSILIDRVEDLGKAYVNGGGVLTSELNPKSFESKKIQGLYFIGETVDVHGPIGGFNLTIAFSSGYTASKHIMRNLQSYISDSMVLNNDI